MSTVIRVLVDLGLGVRVHVRRISWRTCKVT